MEGKLEFIVGRAGSGKTEACLSAIVRRLQAAPLGPACILLLPEHMTYQAERQLAQRISRSVLRNSTPMLWHAAKNMLPNASMNSTK